MARRTPPKGTKTPVPPEPAEDSRWPVIRLILAAMSSGKSLRQACIAVPDAPPESTFRLWATKNEPAGLAAQYASAREALQDCWAERITELGEAAREAAEGAEKGTGGPLVQAYRLEADNLKWILSKLAPKKYGDRLELAGDTNAPLVVRYINRPVPG